MMTDLLATLYPWVKALHIMAVLTWMAGIFYLPRLYVYHVERGQNGAEEPAASLTVMEWKLLRYIMNPSLIAVWLFGLMLVATPGIVDWSSIWPWTKAVGVIAMTWFHMWLGARRKDLAAGTNTRTGRTYRMMNEVPTILMVVIVLSVVLKF